MTKFFKEFCLVIALVSAAFALSLAIPVPKAHAGEPVSMRHIQAYVYTEPSGRGFVRLDLNQDCPARLLSQINDQRGWRLAHEYVIALQDLRPLCWRRINTSVQIQYTNGSFGRLMWSDFNPMYEAL